MSGLRTRLADHGKVFIMLNHVCISDGRRSGCVWWGGSCHHSDGDQHDRSHSSAQWSAEQRRADLCTPATASPRGRYEQASTFFIKFCSHRGSLHTSKIILYIIVHFWPKKVCFFFCHFLCNLCNSADQMFLRKNFISFRKLAHIQSTLSCISNHYSCGPWCRFECDSDWQGEHRSGEPSVSV